LAYVERIPVGEEADLGVGAHSCDAAEPRNSQLRFDSMDERSAEPPQFQYRVINIGSFSSAERMQHALGDSGKDGWELISVYDKSTNWFAGMEKGFMLFKRSVAPGTTLRPEEWCETHSFEGTTTYTRKDRPKVEDSTDSTNKSAWLDEGSLDDPHYQKEER
jgi:hypothetical protein